jgi:CHC2 zinc finger
MRNAHPTRGQARPAFNFKRDQLPSPAKYFGSQGLKFKGGGEWKNAVCPFHDDSKPSLRVRLNTGGFRCMVCGAHGGDVLAFHMQRTGLGFVEAAKALGAWGAT